MTDARDERAQRQLALPTFSPRLYRWFTAYLRRYFKKHFTAVRLASRVDGTAFAGRPVVVYANHPSWWDPILFMLVHGAALPGRPLYGPMDAKALAKYGFMRRLGVFGVDPDSPRGAATFLRTSRAVLARPDAALWITAQGRFGDVRERPVRLAPGLAHLARSIPDLVILPLAVEYPFWNERNPEALAWFGEPIETAAQPQHDVPAWNALLSARLTETQDALARASAARDPSAFLTLIGGRVGVGGVYDVWRRAKAWVRGRRFRPAHGELAP